MNCNHGKRVEGCENCDAEIAEMRASDSNDLFCADDIRYLISRLERIKELVESDNKHMAIAKLLADITALKSTVET